MIKRAITVNEAIKREQSKALDRIAKVGREKTIHDHQFMEPCFNCGSAGECRHRRADNG